MARWTERQYLRHALTAALTTDKGVAEQVGAVLAADTAPPSPFPRPEDDETPEQEQARLRFDLLSGKDWPFFRDTRLDPPATDDNGDEEDAT